MTPKKILKKKEIDMSLRDLGVFNSLEKGHPTIDQRCWKCNMVLSKGTRTALNSIETEDQTKSLTVKAALVCATCHLRGIRIKTPDGERIVFSIKEGDGSTFPVITTDNKQWKDSEVFVVKK